MSLSQKKLSLTLRDAGPGFQIQASLELALAALDHAGSHREASAAKAWPSRPSRPQLHSGFPCSAPPPYVLGEWRLYRAGSCTHRGKAEPEEMMLEGRQL